MALLKKDLDSVRGHRQQYRDRRGSVPIPVVSLVRQADILNDVLNEPEGFEILGFNLLQNKENDPNNQKEKEPENEGQVDST
jgi:hypothetical protein